MVAHHLIIVATYQHQTALPYSKISFGCFKLLAIAAIKITLDETHFLYSPLLPYSPI